MAENETQKKFNKNHLFLKMTLQLLVSISVLSLFISYYSDLSHFLHYYYCQVAAMLCPVLSQTLERKYMFLICNGIIAFLAKTFSFTSYSPSGPNIIDTFDTFMTSNEHGMMPVREMEEPVEHKEAAIRGLCQAIITETDDDKDDGEKVGGGCLVPSFSEEDGEDEANMSTDELNRKFDEFIRKMKEEIRIGAQLQPVAVQGILVH
ncbi:hypothetical protein RHGRI_004170 [Rhododendron griersonianum]|uniref:DUF4408 domain-containing protein n=1 Tax=Rhododendron griersonianum TaxID=479676 RepID=A0AAV6L8F9_9ERIC|nr:hypothetical protein RHGRI_004170 [Rhododendron griersonianum]